MKKTTVLSILTMMIFGFLLTGCQQDDHEPKIEPEQTTGQYDKRVYELSKDPEIQAELQFMKDELGYDLSHISIIKVGPWKGDYAHKEGWDVIVEPRINVKSLMEEHSLTKSGTQARHRKNSIMATSVYLF